MTSRHARSPSPPPSIHRVILIRIEPSRRNVRALSSPPTSHGIYRLARHIGDVHIRYTAVSKARWMDGWILSPPFIFFHGRVVYPRHGIDLFFFFFEPRSRLHENPCNFTLGIRSEIYLSICNDCRKNKRKNFESSKIRNLHRFVRN